MVVGILGRSRSLVPKNHEKVAQKREMTRRLRASSKLGSRNFPLASKILKARAEKLMPIIAIPAAVRRPIFSF